MQEREALEATRVRERAAYYYVRALDDGDLEAAASIMQSAQEGFGTGRDARRHRRGLRGGGVACSHRRGGRAGAQTCPAYQHLPSAFTAEEPHQPAPLTVGDVASRMKTDQSIGPADAAATERLIHSTVAVPPCAKCPGGERTGAGVGRSCQRTVLARVPRQSDHALAWAESPSGAPDRRRGRRVGAAPERCTWVPARPLSVDAGRPEDRGSGTEPGAVGVAVARAFADAGLDTRLRDPGRVPLDELNSRLPPPDGRGPAADLCRGAAIPGPGDRASHADVSTRGPAVGRLSLRLPAR